MELLKIRKKNNKKAIQYCYLLDYTFQETPEDDLLVFNARYWSALVNQDSRIARVVQLIGNRPRSFPGKWPVNLAAIIEKYPCVSRLNCTKR